MKSLHNQLSHQLVRYSFGRIILHLVCAASDHHLRWHWQGILREL